MRGHPSASDQLRSAGDVVGVVVGLHHIGDAHTQFLLGFQVGADIGPRVDDRGHPSVGIGDQIRRAAKVGVEDLPQDHGPRPSDP